MDTAASTIAAPSRLNPVPLPANIKSAQPGGGVCFAIEQAFGGWRRWYLRTFRRTYVHRMAETRQGTDAGAPHPVLDPRDLKYARVVCSAQWPPELDPFGWRGELGIARWGWAELIVMGLPLLVLTIAWAVTPLWPLSIATGIVLAWLVSFFRNPRRNIPLEPGLVVSPADGKIAEVTRLEHHDYVGGPAVRIGIFLSIFNVHVNRSPAAARVIALHYHPGKFLNALNPESAILNENMVIQLEENAAPFRRMVVRQIAGLFARKIVCDLKPGDDLIRGRIFGMIKLGSRTELILPDEPGLEVTVRTGDKIRAGSDVVAKFRTPLGSE